jgi:hypothetical protein
MGSCSSTLDQGYNLKFYFQGKNWARVGKIVDKVSNIQVLGQYAKAKEVFLFNNDSRLKDNIQTPFLDMKRLKNMIVWLEF